jgi:hypothetical protein
MQDFFILLIAVYRRSKQSHTCTHTHLLVELINFKIHEIIISISLSTNIIVYYSKIVP